ncbi:MAG: low affinity iron permease family protein, partial [Tsuneonella sp.]
TTINPFLWVYLTHNTHMRCGGAHQPPLAVLRRPRGGARGQFIGIEHMTDRQIEMIRAALEREAEDGSHLKTDAQKIAQRLVKGS